MCDHGLLRQRVNVSTTTATTTTTTTVMTVNGYYYYHAALVPYTSEYEGACGSKYEYTVEPKMVGRHNTWSIVGYTSF